MLLLNMWLITAINLIGLLYLISEVNNLKSKLDPNRPKLPSGTPVMPPVPPAGVFVDKKNAVLNSGDDVLVRFAAWFARDWPLKVGAIFVFLGFVWLVTYAFLNNWIGQTGRIVFGIMAGSAILAWGSDSVKKNVYQGEIITALGAGVVLLSVYAAQYVYTSMFPHVVALMLVAIVSIAVGYISYVSNTARLATLGLLVGSAAPLLTASESKEPFGLFSYIFFVIVGAVWLVRKKGWRFLTVISIFVVWIYSLFWFNAYLSPSEIITVRFFAVTFTILFYLLSLGGFLYDRSGDKIDAYVGVLSGLYALHWIMTIISEHNRSLVCVAVAVAFMVGAMSIFKKYQERYPVYLFTAVSIMFLVAATFIELEGAILPVVLSVEAFAIIVFADYMYGRDSIKYVACLFILPVLLSLPNLFENHLAPETGMLLWVNISLYAASLYLYRYSFSGKREPLMSAKAIAVAAGIYSIFLVSTIIDYYIGRTDPFTARALIMVIYAVSGIGLYVYGLHENKLWTKKFGLYLTLYVIARLLLVEVWKMELGPRIITFFTVGIVFIISVFIRRSKHEIE